MRTLPPSRILTAVSVLVVSGCASASFGRRSPQTVLWPSPPDTARVQFLFSFSNERDVRGRVGGFLSTLLDEDPEVRAIEKPYGIAFRSGRFYVCDSMLPGVVVVDMRARTFEQWQPPGDGTLRKPINCSIDPDDGRLFVADTDRQQVVVFDSTGAYRSVFGQPDDRPGDVFVTETGVYVADLRTQQIKAYDKATGRLRVAFPSPEAPAAERISKIVNVWVQDDLVYVTDFGVAGVKVYHTDGTFVRSWGSMGRMPGQFIRPKGIAVDRTGIAYVVDTGFQNVQMFDREGRLLMDFGGGHDGPGGMTIPAQVHVTYDGLELFEPYVDPQYELEYVILVTNQYGPTRVSGYGFVRTRGNRSP